MKYKFLIVGLFIILPLFISISWYGKLDYTHTHECMDMEEFNISYDEATKILVHPIYRKNRYYYRNVTKIFCGRTNIPFVYDRDEPYVEKQYYSEAPIEENQR